MDIKFTQDKIYLLGDSHAYRVLFGLVKTLPKDCTALSLGDNGEGFAHHSNDAMCLNKINELCKIKNIVLYVIRGNHTNPDVYRRGYIFSNLFLVPDYSTATFPNGKIALLVGGGISIDRLARKEGVDYWSDEATIYHKVDKQYNILFSHDAPEYFNFSTDSLRYSHLKDYLLRDKTLLQDCLNQRNVINNIVEDISCEYVCSGHFHCSLFQEKNGIKYRCLNINEIVEFNSDKIFDSLVL